MARKYRAIRLGMAQAMEYGMEEEAQLIAEELFVEQKDIICIMDATTKDGQTWVEEIWDETEIGFPKRLPGHRVLNMKDKDGYNFQMIVHKIKMPGVGMVLISQDASPMGIFLTTEQAKGLDIQYEND